MYLVLLASLAPPLFIVTHTLMGILLMIPYGVDKWRWRAGAIEVLAKRKKDGTTRIWFKPGAQTWGLVIFCSNDYNYAGNAPLQVHERIHILQTYLFGAFYLLTYALSFAVLYALVLCEFDWWDRRVNSRGILDDDVWHAYRMIPWERWAYGVQGEFERGEREGEWGSFK